MKKTLLAVVIASTTLTGCGGGSSDNASPATTTPSATSVLLSGRAIDGYIVGANVFYDFNSNGIHDADEPSAITGANGVFDITDDLTEYQTECFDYVPIIVDVPVGAIDEDLGVVEEAYTLTYPPAFVFDYDLRRNGANITPISTILWESAQVNIERDAGVKYSCEAIKDDEAMKKMTGDAMRNVTGDLVWHLNVTEKELWEDYIASGNVEMYDIAQDLMVAIRKGFDETYELSKEYPNAHVNVAYYPEDKRDTGAVKGDWYKSVAIRENGNLTETVHRVNDEWEPDILLLVQTETTVANTTGDVQEIHEYRTHDTHGFLDYICSVTESIQTSERIAYAKQHADLEYADDASILVRLEELDVYLADELLATEDKDAAEAEVVVLLARLDELAALADDVWSMENKSTTYDLDQDACIASKFDVNADSYLMNLTTARYTAIYDEEYTKYKWNDVPAEYAHLVGFSTDLDAFDVAAFEAELAGLPRTTLGGQQLVGADWWEHTKRFIEDPNKVSTHKTNTPVEMPNGQLSYDYRFVSHPDGTYEYQCAVGDGTYSDCTK